MKYSHEMPFGAKLRRDGGVDFSLWAPAARQASVFLGDRDVAASVTADGWWGLHIAHADAQTRYQWRVDGKLVPDPASRSNPWGLEAPSIVTDPWAHDWAADWNGRAWTDIVAYQMHVGTYTPEGTFNAAARRIPELARLGITALQLMPVASADGEFGWGYDGVLLFAPNSSYGTPDDMKAFVATAQAHGLAVLLDVVYNHFGPAGNYLPHYAPQFESDHHETPWGKAVNFDGVGSTWVREFFIQNALYWLEEFRLDGLRLDAVHAMVDEGPEHIVAELTRRARHRFGDRQVHIVLENDHNNPMRLGAGDARCDGQWNGDFHHCLHVLMTGETGTYYAEYADDPVARLGRVMTLGFSREGANESGSEAPDRRDATSTISLVNAVNFLQCHDQIGNRVFGDRLHLLAAPDASRLATAILLLSPSIPLLFMGEEFASRRPFLYFADAKREMRDLVRDGRKQEMREAPDADQIDSRGEPPDPCDRGSVVASVIESSVELDQSQRATWRWTRELLTLRRLEIAPRLPSLSVGTHGCRRFGTHGLAVTWHFDDGSRLQVILNLGKSAQLVSSTELDSEAVELFRVGDVAGDRLGPWSGVWHRIPSPARFPTPRLGRS